MVRASDSGVTGRGFDPQSGRRVVSVARHIYIPKEMLIPRKWCLCPDMSEKWFTVTKSKKTRGPMVL